MTWRFACRNGTSRYRFFKYSKSRVAATCLPFSFPVNAASPMNWRSPFMFQYNYYNGNSQNLSKLISIQIDRKVQGTANWKALLHIYANDHKRFDDRNWASIMNKLKNFSERDAQLIQNDNRFCELIQNLEQALVTGLQNFSPQSLSNILHALAKMKVRNEAILDLIENTSDWMYEDAKDNPQSLANIAWAYATLQYKAPNIFRIINDMSSEIVRNGNGQDISNIAWACATLHYENLSFFGEMENYTERLLKNGTPQNISNTIWACATLHFVAPNLLNAIDLHSESIVGQGTPQEIANITWAFATLKFDAQQFLSAVDSRFLFIVREGNPQDLANITWAFATLKFDAQQFLSAVDSRFLFIVREGNPQDLANITWAFATLKLDAQQFLSAVNSRFLFIVREGTPQAIANITWAFATLRYFSSALLTAVDLHSDHIAKEGSPQNIANIAWAFAMLGYQPPNFFRHIAGQIERLRTDFNAQDISNLLWSLAILGMPDERSNLVLRHLWKHLDGLDAAEFSRESLRQLAQVSVYARLNGISLQRPPPELENLVATAIKTGEENPSSRFEDEYSKLLDQIGFKHERNVSPFQDDLIKFLTIDFACSEQKIAIECDGDSHFLKSFEKEVAFKGPFRENGPTMVKRKMLKQLGWKVVSIPYHDNIAMGKKKGVDSNALKKEYLRKKLKEVGARLPRN